MDGPTDGWTDGRTGRWAGGRLTDRPTERLKTFVLRVCGTIGVSRTACLFPRLLLRLDRAARPATPVELRDGLLWLFGRHLARSPRLVCPLVCESYERCSVGHKPVMPSHEMSSHATA